LPVRPFQVGDRVRLLKLDEWFFKDIPAEDVSFLRTCVGRETELPGFDDYGHAELMFVRSSTEEDYKSHTVWVDQSWIEKV
jgi:hypothetical protein